MAAKANIKLEIIWYDVGINEGSDPWISEICGFQGVFRPHNEKNVGHPPPLDKLHYTTLSVKKKMNFRILGFTDDRNLKLTICFFSDLLGWITKLMIR